MFFIKIKVRLIAGMIITLVTMGILNLRQVIIIETKYNACISCSVLLLYLAAICFSIAVNRRTVLAVKVWRMFCFGLIGVSLITLLLLPLVVAGIDLQGFEKPLILVNLGIILVLVFINELMHNLGKCRKQLGKPLRQDPAVTYFEQLPKITSTRKKPIFFEFD